MFPFVIAGVREREYSLVPSGDPVMLAPSAQVTGVGFQTPRGAGLKSKWATV